MKPNYSGTRIILPSLIRTTQIILTIVLYNSLPSKLYVKNTPFTPQFRTILFNWHPLHNSSPLTPCVRLLFNSLNFSPNWHIYLNIFSLFSGISCSERHPIIVIGAVFAQKYLNHPDNWALCLIPISLDTLHWRPMLKCVNLAPRLIRTKN